MEDDGAAGEQRAGLDVEADVPPTVGQDRVLAAVAIDGDGEPRRQLLERQRIGITGAGRFGRDPERSGIEIGMPDEPCLGRRAIGVFGESAASRSSDRRAPFPTSRRWRARTRPRSRDRDAAIPTSARPGRCHAVRHKSATSASPATGGARAVSTPVPTGHRQIPDKQARVGPAPALTDRQRD